MSTVDWYGGATRLCQQTCTAMSNDGQNGRKGGSDLIYVRPQRSPCQQPLVRFRIRETSGINGSWLKYITRRASPPVRNIGEQGLETNSEDQETAAFSWAYPPGFLCLSKKAWEGGERGKEGKKEENGRE